MYTHTARRSLSALHEPFSGWCELSVCVCFIYHFWHCVAMCSCDLGLFAHEESLRAKVGEDLLKCVPIAAVRGHSSSVMYVIACVLTRISLCFTWNLRGCFCQTLLQTSRHDGTSLQVSLVCILVRGDDTRNLRLEKYWNIGWSAVSQADIVEVRTYVHT